MGVEVEYGVTVQGQPLANHMVASSQVVNAYASATVKARRARWDFEEESPLRDAAGFDMSRRSPTRASSPTRTWAGQRHPHQRRRASTSTTPPGVLHARGHHAARHRSGGQGGELVMLDASGWRRRCRGTQPITLYKNNTDNKGASYGAHENYLMRRSTPFGDIVRHLTPFFVSRQVFCGAGPGRHRAGRPRATASSSASAPTSSRSRSASRPRSSGPIINTRDEPHADPEKYRRLHVIIGDANLAEVSTYLKVGTTALVLAMIEDRFITRDLSVDGPVAALRAVSHDPTLQHLLTLDDGRKLTAVQLQLEYLDLARSTSRTGTAPTPTRRPSTCCPLGVGARPARARPDAVRRGARLGGEAQAARAVPRPRRPEWDDAKLQLIDYQYSDIRPRRASTTACPAAGSSAARRRRWRRDARPPEDTRAYFRGRCLEKYADQVAAASWDSVIFDLPGRESLQRVPTIDPLRGPRRTWASSSTAVRGGGLFTG
jgi:proteasome accessory factor A